jgi:hypothetical protein
MSSYNLYVGDASDPRFHWDGGDYSGNIPEIIMELSSLGLPGCARARNLLESPKYGGRVLDWGASGARMNKARIVEFLAELSGVEQRCTTPRDDLNALEEDREYILFACEQ